MTEGAGRGLRTGGVNLGRWQSSFEFFGVLLDAELHDLGAMPHAPQVAVHAPDQGVAAVAEFSAHG